MPSQPRIEDPSKPSPSSNVPASSVAIGNEQCCHLPSMSTNLRSSISASCFLANLKKSSAVLGASSGDIGSTSAFSGANAMTSSSGRQLRIDGRRKTHAPDNQAACDVQGLK